MKLFIIKKKSAAYICVPKSINTFSEIKDKEIIKFSNAIAELISTMLDISGQKHFFYLLFKSSREERNFILRNAIGDEKLDYLSQAKELLGEEIDSKSDFWRNVQLAINPTISETATNEVFIKENAITSEIVDGIDYCELNTEKNYIFISQLFKQLGIDIVDFNDYSNDVLSFSGYWLTQFNEERNKNFRKYKLYIYDLNKNTEDGFDKYNILVDNYFKIIPDIPNSIYFDLNSIYSSVYQIDLDKFEKIDAKEFEIVLNEKKAKYTSEEIKKLNRSDDYLESYYLFDKINDLKEKDNSQESIETAKRKTEEEIKNIVDKYSGDYEISQDDFEKPEERESTYKERIPKSGNLKDGENNNQNDSLPMQPEKTQEELDEIKKINGEAGEKNVYKYLKAQPNISLVKWLSKNGERNNAVDKGDDKLGYDMTYIDSKGVLHYVEVKASSEDRIEFHISKNEIREGMRHPRTYEVFFVFVNDKKSIIYPLGNIFNFAEGEDLTHNNHFSAESNNYVIRMTKKTNSIHI